MSTIPMELTSNYAATGFAGRTLEIIATHGYKTVCELGGGRQPLLTLGEVTQLGLDYTILDISQQELDKAPVGYRKICADICQPDESLSGSFDFIFSKYLAEHVSSGVRMHQAVYALLKPGGRAFHFFPTLFSPPFVLNRLLPYRAGQWVRDLFAPSNRDLPRFPARYSKCFGPSRRMICLFNRLGYRVEDYRPFYGTDYFRRIPVLRQLDSYLTHWAANRRNRYLSAYAYVVLFKPANALDGGGDRMDRTDRSPVGD